METTPKPTVLLVDDDPSILMSVGDQLRFHGYDVVNAESAERAIERLDRVKPDLIILDISMPGLGGMAFLTKIAESGGGMRYPVLIFTARAELDRFFSQTGVDGFLSKMTDPETLLREVNHIVEKYRARNVPANGDQGRQRIVIAEEDQRERQHRVNFLQRHGFDAIGVGTGYEAIAQATAQRPALVLLAYLLRHMNGPAVATMLGSMPSTQGIPVIVFDGSGVGDRNAQYTNVARFVPSSEDHALLKSAREVLASINPNAAGKAVLTGG